MNVIHHVGKPPRDPEMKASDMSEADFQYLGFGTSEIQNAFRAVNILDPFCAGTFRLVLSKRGERAGAKDLEGNWTRTIYLEHSKSGICWLQVPKPDDDEQGRGRPPSFKLDDLLDEMSVVHSIKTSALLKRLHSERNMSRATFFRLFDQGKREGCIVQSEDGWIKKSSEKQ
jgi:hypothetical protein